MLSVYSHAKVTIAAATSDNSQGGCFSPTGGLGGQNKDSLYVRVNGSNIGLRTGNQEYTFEIRPGATYDHISTQFSDSPLNQRAWVLQEMCLSPRILFFGRD